MGRGGAQGVPPRARSLRAEPSNQEPQTLSSLGQYGPRGNSSTFASILDTNGYKLSSTVLIMPPVCVVTAQVAFSKKCVKTDLLEIRTKWKHLSLILTTDSCF